MPSAPRLPLAGTSRGVERVQEEAALWFARMHGDQLTDARRAAFAVWLAADEHHRREYEAMEQTWEQSARLAECAIRKHGNKKALRTAAGLAGIAVLCAWLGWGWLDGRVVTAPGERRHMQLADGSELHIAPNTRLRVKLDSSMRRLQLDDGQIAVTVATDPQRPFEVVAGGGIIRDVGTRFEVSTGHERTRVVVADGAVEISLPGSGANVAQRMEAGEAAEFDGQRVLPARPVDAAAALGWTKGQLAFEAAPLDEVATALNRYRKAPVYLSDPALARIRISGVFQIDNEAAALRAIELVAPVKFVENGTRVEARSAE